MQGADRTQHLFGSRLPTFACHLQVTDDDYERVSLSTFLLYFDVPRAASMQDHVGIFMVMPHERFRMWQ